MTNQFYNLYTSAYFLYLPHNYYISSYMEQINQQIRSFILTSPNDQQLTNFLNQQLSPSIKPKLSLHQINTKTITKPTLVYARLMVQDIRDAYYYISFAMKRPFNPQDPYFLYKYGHEPQNEPQNVHQNKQYINVFTDRYTVVGTPIRYQSKWMDEAQGRVNDFEQILIEVDGQANYKLGQILNIVAFYDPDLKKLFMVREIDNQQAYQAGLQTKSVNQQLSLQSISATRYQLMNWLSSYASQTFSQLLLFSLISDQTFFLGCEADISALVAEIYPRVAHIKLVHPCNKPLFPFKNEEGELQLTDMQMSILPTFVSIDFSQFSKQQKVVVEGTSLSNLSGLKMFVQDGKTIYKWQIGESHYQHPHRGIIVKASQLISPHFNPKNQKISLQYGNLNMISQSKKQMFRTYLRDISQLNPCLKDDERKLIEKQLMDCKQKQKLGGNLVKIMSLSKLRAKSYGREIIGLQDFRECKKLLQECENGG